MNELTRAERWLYERLSGDATLAALVGGRVYSTVAPQGAVYPFVLYSLLYSADVATANNTRVFARLSYVVRAVGQTASNASLEAIADRVDVALQRIDAPTAGAHAEAGRERAFFLGEIVDGVQYRHVGGVYRLLVY